MANRLAHILNERADINARIDGLAKDAVLNTRLSEGEEPTVDPNTAVNELLSDLETHLKMSLRISDINRNTIVEFDGREIPLSDLILFRQNYSRRKNLLDKIATSANPTRTRWGRQEVKEQVHLDLDNVKAALSEVNKKLRTIDNIMQEANWIIEPR